MPLSGFFQNADDVAVVVPGSDISRGIALAQRLEAGVKAGAAVLLARGTVLIDGFLVHAGIAQSVMLETEVLGVALGAEDFCRSSKPMLRQACPLANFWTIFLTVPAIWLRSS